MTPREMRAKAAEYQAKAQAIYDRHRGEDSPEFTEEEVRDFDAATAEADRWVARAAEVEARENRLNDLDARLKAQGGGDTARPNAPLPHEDQANTRGGLHQYSLLKALREMDPKSKHQTLTGLELETHVELSKRKGRPAQGLLIPWSLPIDGHLAQSYRERMGIERRDLTTSTGAGGVYTVVSPTMIEFLRNLMLSRRLGARVMADMNGNFSIPKQTGTGTAYWVTEGNAPTESTPAIGSLGFSPSTMGAFTDYSRAFLNQTSIDAEMFVREDLTTVLAIELDRVCFNGSGVGAEPEGIIPNSSVNVVAIGTDGGAMTWAKTVAMESAVETQNALNGNLAFVTSPKGRAHLKTTTRVASSTFGDFLWADAQEVNGYPAYSSNQIPSNLSKGSASGTLTAAIFGDFTQVIFALWGGVDTLVDPYTGGTAGNVRIVVLQDADFQVRQPKAFSVCKDILHGF